MADRFFEDPSLAGLYDSLCPREDRADFGFYLPLVMQAHAVLDIGCGTGALLHWARESGHGGRLCGLDPARGMIEQAEKRKDVEWLHGNLGARAWQPEFDLAVMTGHAFQVLVTDEELRGALGAIRAALVKGGRFAFETRNPLVREWETWRPENLETVVDGSGAVVTMHRKVEHPVEGGIVEFTHTFTCSRWEEPKTSGSTLRFLDVDSLGTFLSEGGLEIERQYGNWNGEPLVESSPEIITVARRA